MNKKDKMLMKGNEALAEGAIRAGCRYFFGYPITPQNEIPEYMSRRLPEVGGVFIQAESEVAASNMVYGAAGAGARVMTSSSGPGISLKQEGLSYIAGAELPCVVINVARGGPGLGNIAPSQGDYFQATKGGGHGDYKLVVLAPATVQEAFDLTREAFDIADKYRNPVMVLADGILGQMMEPVEVIEPEEVASAEPHRAAKPWATTGTGGRRAPNLINSLYIDPHEMEAHCLHLMDKYKQIMAHEVRYDSFELDDAVELVVVAYGTMSRIARTAIRHARAHHKRMKVGLLRPISLWPFPVSAFDQLFERTQNASRLEFLVAEMSCGQMVEDVRLAVGGRAPVHLYARPGGVVPSPEELFRKIEEVIGAVKEYRTGEEVMTL